MMRKGAITLAYDEFVQRVPFKRSSWGWDSDAEEENLSGFTTSEPSS